MPACKDDDPVILRMFGSSEPPHAARFQFVDLFLSKDNKTELVGLTEAKAENVIDRKTCVANPRIIERVTAGTVFDFILVYNVEKQNEVEEDFRTLAKGMKLLQLDYLGGHGTRGSGRVSLKDFQLTPYGCDVDIKQLEGILNEVSAFELIPERSAKA